MDALLTVTGLTKRFSSAGPPVIDRLTFAVQRGEIFALLGPSGCGKTTSLRLMAGFERADDGHIVLDDRVLSGPHTHVPPERRGMGLVFQDYALFPHLSVVDNVTFGLRGQTKNEQREKALRALRLVGLQGFEERTPHELSGGQQQRVAIARSLAPSPRLLLLDEPFSNLDALLRQNTRSEIRGVLKQEGITSVLVTHDQEEALSFADRVAVMRHGQIEQVGTPEEVYYQPRTLFVAQFLGRTNLLFSLAQGTEADTPLGRVHLSRDASGPVLLSLRPEHVTLDAAAAHPDRPHASIVAREFKGHDITFRVEMDGSEYLVHTHNRMDFQPGDRVALRPLEPAVVLESQQPPAAPLSGVTSAEAAAS